MELCDLANWAIIAYLIGVVINLIIAMLYFKYSEDTYITLGGLLLIIFLVLSSFCGLAASLIAFVIDFLCEHGGKVIWRKQKK